MSCSCVWIHCSSSAMMSEGLRVQHSLSLGAAARTADAGSRAATSAGSTMETSKWVMVSCSVLVSTCPLPARRWNSWDNSAFGIQTAGCRAVFGTAAGFCNSAFGLPAGATEAAVAAEGSRDWGRALWAVLNPTPAGLLQQMLPLTLLVLVTLGPRETEVLLASPKTGALSVRGAATFQGWTSAAIPAVRRWLRLLWHCLNAVPGCCNSGSDHSSTAVRAGMLLSSLRDRFCTCALC